jgi:hypothetical protein
VLLIADQAAQVARVAQANGVTVLRGSEPIADLGQFIAARRDRLQVAAR